MPGRAAALALVLLLLGCVTTPVDRRSWLQVETPHFEVLSALSLGATRQLALDLERFRAAVGWAGGATLPAPAAPVRVVAFDGRTLVRPFDLRGQPSYFLPEGDGGLVVLRTGGGFRGDASLELRHQLAHWIVRGAGGPSPPLWIDEGFAQVLSTTEVGDRGVEVGVLREDHVRRVRSETWLPVDRLLALSPEDDWSDRSRFDAQTWLLAHYLLLGQPDRVVVNRQLDRYLVLVNQAVSPGTAALRAFGTDLDRALLRYSRRESFDALVVALPVDTPPEPRPLPRAEALTHLGVLSLAIDRDHQAVRYLEEALAEDPGQARAHAALGEAWIRLGRGDESREQLKLALAAGASDPLVQRQAGDYYLAGARRAEEPEPRRELLRLARWHYRKSVALRPSATVYARVARIGLLDGEEPEQALSAARWAHKLQPASLEFALLQARLELAAGNRGYARVLARKVWAQAHPAVQREEARALLWAASDRPGRSGRREAETLHAQP